MPKRVTSAGAHLRDLAPGQHGFEKTPQRWRAVDDTARPAWESNSRPNRADSDVFAHSARRPVIYHIFLFLQLMLTIGLLTVVVYLYTVIAFNFFRKFYNKGEGEDEDWKCHDMFSVRYSASNAALLKQLNAM